jgi:Rrf2 family iron-sulfur cluster assembly transcriptional regulator
MFSKACEYAFRALIQVARCTAEGRHCSVDELAKGGGSPVAFTAKVMQKLTRAGLVESVRGWHGGYWMDERLAKRVRLADVVKAIDDDSVYKGCALGLKQCSHTNPCPLHERFIAVRDDLRRMLEGTSIQDLVEGVEPGALLRIR